jgi:ABC-type branched-subunit amino acid transport system substrate-binding protein
VQPFQETRISRARALLGVTLLGVTWIALALLAAACSGIPGARFGSPFSPPNQSQPQPNAAIGAGQIKVGLVLPLSAIGNAGFAAQAMKNAGDMALAEFNNTTIQLLVKDDAGTPPGAQQAAQQAVQQGAEIVLGPLFAPSVQAAAQVTRPRNIPMIAFSTDTNIAAAGVYLLSFLPESDVDRIVDYAMANGKRSFGALVPDTPYGSVVDAEFRQAVGRKGGRVVGLEHYPVDRQQMQAAVARIAAAAREMDAVFVPDGAETLPAVVQSLSANGFDLRRIQLLGTGLWDDPRVFADPGVQGGWFAAPDSAGYRNFVGRYRRRFGQDPVRTSTLAYDAVSLVAKLAGTPRRFAAEVLTNPSGFSGIDGIFRFRSDGTNQRGLAVLRVTSAGGEVISPAPRSFTSGT